MSYSITLAQALTQVFDRAAELKAHRIAGYAANLDFWLDELEHCLSVLKGYHSRWVRMRDGTQDYVRANPQYKLGRDRDTRTSRSIKHAELDQTRRAVEQAADRFLRRCLCAGLVSPEQRTRAEALLGFPFGQ